MAIDGWLRYNLVGGDWNHGMDYDFPWNSWEWISSSQLLHSLHDFSEGLVETTNQFKSGDTILRLPNFADENHALLQSLQWLLWMG